jgi:NADPH:quinone reductase-like Zn-dependent oxidoreductase
VLINGAGGGVGTFAIQLAKYYGMEVMAVDSPPKFDLMRSLGADHVIDYAQEDFTKQGKQYDLILDVIARKSPFAYRRTLRPHGQYRAVGGSTGRIFQILFLGSIISRVSSKNIGLLIGKPNEKADMDLLAELYETKKVVPIIEKVYPLTEVAAALRHLEEGHVRGKLVITME